MYSSTIHQQRSQIMFRTMFLTASLLLPGMGAAYAEDYGACATEAARLLKNGGAAYKITGIKNDRDKLEVTYAYQHGDVTVPYDLDDGDSNATKADILLQMDKEEAAVRAGTLRIVYVNLMAVAKQGEPIAYKGIDGSKYAWTGWTRYVMYQVQRKDGDECESVPIEKFVDVDVIPPEVLTLLPK